MQKIFTLSRKAWAISGKLAEKISQLRNALRNSSHPGDSTIAKASPVKTTAVLAAAIRRPRRPLFS
jgi:hypothetical protein